MVATRIAYGKWKSFIQGVEVASFVLFGFVAIFFTAAPKSLNDKSPDQNSFVGFSGNTAHAESPDYFDAGGGGGGDGGGGAGGCGGDGAGGAGGCG